MYFTSYIIPHIQIYIYHIYIYTYMYVMYQKSYITDYVLCIMCSVYMKYLYMYIYIYMYMYIYIYISQCSALDTMNIKFKIIHIHMCIHSHIVSGYITTLYHIQYYTRYIEYKSYIRYNMIYPLYCIYIYTYILSQYALLH